MYLDYEDIVTVKKIGINVGLLCLLTLVLITVSVAVG